VHHAAGDITWRTIMFTTQILDTHRGPPDRHPLHDPRHRGAIHELAQELALPLETVATRYEALLREMLTRARVVDFLPVLVAKQLRKILRPTG
jgi:hypothetical protein